MIQRLNTVIFTENFEINPMFRSQPIRQRHQRGMAIEGRSNCQRSRLESSGFESDILLVFQRLYFEVIYLLVCFEQRFYR